MRKLVLVTVKYDIGNPEPSEKIHLVALNVDKLDHFTANQEMEMAVTKAKLYYEMEMPHAKIISIVPSVTISSDNVKSTESVIQNIIDSRDEFIDKVKQSGKDLKAFAQAGMAKIEQSIQGKPSISERVVDIMKESWDKITPMPTPAAFDIIHLLNENGLEINLIGSDDGLQFNNFHPMSEIPELNPKETDTSYDVLIDIDGYRKDFYIGCYHTDFKEWRLKKEDTDDYEIDMEHARWAYLPLSARDKK